MKELTGTKKVVMVHSLNCMATGDFYYSDLITALIEDKNDKKQK